MTSPRPRRGQPAAPGETAGVLPGRPARSVALLLLLACHAQGRTRSGLESKLADRLTPGLADTVAALLQPLHGVPVLLEQQASVVGDGQLLLPLERLDPRIGRVVAGLCAGVIDERGDIVLDDADLSLEPMDVPGQDRLDLGDLLGGPWLLVRADRQDQVGCRGGPR